MKHNWAMQVSHCFALIQCDRTVSLSLALGVHFVRFSWINKCPGQVTVWGNRKKRLNGEGCFQFWLGMGTTLGVFEVRLQIFISTQRFSKVLR